MKHSEFIRELAKDLGVSIEKARDVHESVVRTLYLGLARDGEVRVDEFGTFRTKWFRGRADVTPTGKATKVPPFARVDFRMAEAMKRALRGRP